MTPIQDHERSGLGWWLSLLSAGVPVIEVRVLGPMEAVVDGGPADLGGPRQRCVLSRLVAEGGRVVSVDRLIEDLYADEAPPRALAAVQSYVSHLRRVLEPGRAPRASAEVLVTSPPGYALRLEREAVDAWRFEDQVRRAAGMDDPAAVHERLSGALACWRGGAFEEFAGMAWADLEASRLDELRLAAAERLAEVALRLGRAAETAAELARLAAEHPLREETWRLLALALYQSGRQGDALAALRRARDHLATELGVDPGPALRGLEEDILAQAPHLAPSPQPPPSRPAPVPSSPAATATTAASSTTAAASSTTAAASSTTAAASSTTASAASALPGEPFIGRDAELAAAMRTAAEAAAGRMRIVLVAGEAGTGKTALAGQVRQRLAEQGWIAVTGRCREDEGAPPGWPWAEALRQLMVTAAPAAPEALAPLLTDGAPVDGDAPAARFRLHRAVAAYLEAASGSAPLLVVLDDLHRADRETLAILSSITADLDQGAGARTLVLGTYRRAEAGEPLSDCLAALAGREPARITLGGLDAAAAAELIRAAAARAVDDATIQVIAERTGGNPFFLKETARLLDAEGAAAATSGVPAGVAEVLARRIARLPAIAQTILAQAAVIGMESGVDVLADVSGAAPDVVLDAVEAGLVTGLVTEPEAGRIRFAHALVRDTLYGGLSRLRRSRLHARAAQAIEGHSRGDVAALAYHFAQAGTEPAAAARYARLAAGQAEQRFAYHEAARLWEQAIACLDRARDADGAHGEDGARAADGGHGEDGARGADGGHGEDGADAAARLELVLGLVRALAHIGELTRARSWRHDAVRAALPLGDPALLARVITAFDVPTLWPTHEYHVTDHELIDAVERTVTELPPGDRLLRCRLLATLAFELDGAEPERGYQASAQAVELARGAGDPAALTIALNGRFFQSYRHDGLEERHRLGAELLALSAKPVTAEALAHLMLMTAHSGAADFAAADRHAAEAGKIADRYNLPVIATRVTAYRALRSALGGDAAAADDGYLAVADQMGRLGMWQHGAALRLLGRFSIHVTQDRAADSVPGLAQMHGSPPWSGLLSEMYALALAAAGRTDEARATARRPRPIFRDMFWLFMTGVRGLLGIAIDDRQRADAAYKALLPFAGRPAGADTGAITLWPTALILGDLARHLGRPGPDTYYRQALTVAGQAKVDSWARAARDRLAR